MSRFPLDRRTFLKGLGVTLGLPLLEGMTPSRGMAAAAAAPRRMAFVFFPNGAIMPDWTPAEAGPLGELPRTLQALNGLKGDINVLSGLAQDNARAKGDGAGDHARSAAAFLTGAHPVKTSGADIRVGQSADQVAAERIGNQTRLPSLELGIEQGRNAGQCDSGYSCAYSSNISWKTATTPMAKEINPRLAFERLFGTARDEAESRAQRDFYRQSILDLVADDAKLLQGRLGRTDRRKIDEYFTSVREIEQRIDTARTSKANEIPEFDVPDGVPRDTAEHIRLMYDLLVLAFRTDTTRIATYMVANEGSNRTYPMVDVKDGHHHLSHHRDDQEKIEKISRIDRFLLDEHARFLQTLKETPEGEGNLLDSSMIVYGSAISDGNRHQHNNLPIVLAGHGGGTIKTGRHLVYEQDTPLNNLYVSMIQRMGCDVNEFGDSTGVLTNLDT